MQDNFQANLYVKNLNLGRVFLAPMAGITDLPFRILCKKFGASLTCGEMSLAKTNLQNNKKTLQRQAWNNLCGLNYCQILGNNPSEMALVAKNLEESGVNIIDINMGCPAKKVGKKQAGAALLSQLDLVENILNSVVSAVDIPVSLKIRTGIDSDNINCMKVGEIAQNSGISMLTIHGRTKQDMFKGNAEYENITQLKKNLSIPIVANGDINNKFKALAVLEQTNADAIMIGRGSLGQPWIFSEIVQYLSDNRDINNIAIDDKEKIATILQHFQDIYAFYGEYQGCRIARKHLGWYLEKNFLYPHLENEKQKLRQDFNKMSEVKAQTKILTDFFNKII